MSSFCSTGSRVTVSALQAAPSWYDLHQAIDYDPSQTPIVVDSLVNPTLQEWSRPTLFREREGWCPYSERVWLALELCNVCYDTVRIDNSGYGPRPSYFSGQTPQMRWPERQGESMEIVYRVFEQFSDLTSQDLADHQTYVQPWTEIMPRRCRPSSRAAFLFQGNGEPLSQSQLEDTLSSIEALMSRAPGPFLTGSDVGPADVFWAPFLERYRYQLPCFYEKLDPMDPVKFKNLRRWYIAMDETVAPYSCHVKGNGASWRKVLSMAGFGNSGVPPNIQANMDAVIAKEVEESRRAMEYGPALWKKYTKDRPYLAKSPSAQGALAIIQNHARICDDAFKRTETWKSSNDLDDDLRLLTKVLLDTEPKHISPKVKTLAMFLTERM